jgi:hypothetical protein
MKDEEKERRRQDIRLTLAPVGQAAGILALFVIAFLIPFVFILKANVLGFWWTVLLVLYLSIICGIYWVVLHRRHMMDLRGLMGDEAFYEHFPKEKIWDERLARFGAWRDRVFRKDR